jgi:Tuberculosis necrotizing toxin
MLSMPPSCATRSISAFLGLCGIGNFFTDFFKDIQHLLRDVPIVGTIVEVAAAAICLGAIVCAVTAAFLSTTAVSGLETGSFKLGLRAGLIAAATAVAFWEVGNLTGVDPNGQHIPPQFGTPAYAFNVVAHAAVGCASAVASGGKCGPSALAGGVTSAAGPAINGNGFFFGVVANAALGGGAAVLGGGKFENGAITGAFGYLFNAALSPEACEQLGIGSSCSRVVEGGGGPLTMPARAAEASAADAAAPDVEAAAPTGTALVPYYPPNDGFAGTPTLDYLQPGTLLERWGYEGGTYLAPAGTAPESLSLSYGTTSLPYNTYTVMQPTPVLSGQAYPWFGEWGEGPSTRRLLVLGHSFKAAI